jgi:outer membrane protein assembly factor BamB
VVLILTALLAFAGQTHGWRGDGSGRFEGTPPASFSPTSGAAWSVALPSWGNASPVVFGDQICVTAEPTQVLCFDRRSGAPRWKATNDYVDTLSGAERAEVEAKLQEAVRLQSELKDAQRAYSRLQREARRAGSDPELSAASAELDQMKRTLDSTAAWRTPADKEIIGYTSATPVTDGTSLFVSVGHGVVSRFEKDGTRTWSRWLGPHAMRMRGYDTGNTASPLLAGGVLVVPYGKLRGLDPKTGATVWESGEYRDYGTPAVVDVGGTDVLVTPDGRLVRASDGKQLQDGLADIWYVGPTVSGTDVYFVGGKSTGHNAGTGGVDASAWRLSGSGDAIRATQRWATKIPTKETFYAAPVYDDGILYAVTHRGQFFAVDATNGSVLYEQDLSERLTSDVFPTPILASGQLYLGAYSGEYIVAKAGRSYAKLGEGFTGGGRATPIVVGGRLYVRATEHLYAFE